MKKSVAVFLNVLRSPLKKAKLEACSSYQMHFAIKIGRWLGQASLQQLKGESLIYWQEKGSSPFRFRSPHFRIAFYLCVKLLILAS